jgi:hypothetical protein
LLTQCTAPFARLFGSARSFLDPFLRVLQGLVALFWALYACAEVSAYGYGFAPGSPGHYSYGNSPQPYLDNTLYRLGMHDFDYEHRLLERLVSAGVLKRPMGWARAMMVTFGAPGASSSEAPSDTQDDAELRPDRPGFAWWRDRLDGSGAAKSRCSAPDGTILPDCAFADPARNPRVLEMVSLKPGQTTGLFYLREGEDPLTAAKRFVVAHSEGLGAEYVSALARQVLRKWDAYTQRLDRLIEEARRGGPNPQSTN